MAKTRRTATPLSVDQAIVAVLIAAADANRHISPAEAERPFVRALARTLKLPAAQADAVVRVMRVKNSA